VPGYVDGYAAGQHGARSVFFSAMSGSTRGEMTGINTHFATGLGYDIWTMQRFLSSSLSVGKSRTSGLGMATGMAITIAQVILRNRRLVSPYTSLLIFLYSANLGHFTDIGPWAGGGLHNTGETFAMAMNDSETIVGQ